MFDKNIQIVFKKRCDPISKSLTTEQKLAAKKAASPTRADADGSDSASSNGDHPHNPLQLQEKLQERRVAKLARVN